MKRDTSCPACKRANGQNHAEGCNRKEPSAPSPLIELTRDRAGVARLIGCRDATRAEAMAIVSDWLAAQRLKEAKAEAPRGLGGIPWGDA